MTIRNPADVRVRFILGSVFAFVVANLVLRVLNMSATVAHPVGRLTGFAGFMIVLAASVGAYGAGRNGFGDRLAQCAAFVAAIGTAAVMTRAMPGWRFAAFGTGAFLLILLFRNRAARTYLLALSAVLVTVLAGAFILAFPYSAAKNYYHSSATICNVLGIGYVSAVVLLVSRANLLGNRIIRWCAVASQESSRSNEPGQNGPV